VADIFMAVEPMAGKRWVSVTLEAYPCRLGDFH
jgi:hypothetical protein